jgi:DeoR/GlpR family transcriptional regulator of sugar metabolism
MILIKIKLVLRGNNMNKRQIEILNITSRESQINVTELAKIFGVSEVTIRKDLRQLDKEGMIKRMHGGAMLVTDDNISNRLCLNYDVKKKIAREASKLVKDGETVMIESGSTAAILAKELSKKQNITIITNSLFIVNYIKKCPNIQIITLGGILQKNSEVLVGPLVKYALEGIYVDKFFIGVDGFSEENGFTSADVMRAEMVRTMAKKADKLIVITDSSKFGVKGPVHLVNLDEVNTIITDSNIEKKYIDLFTSQSVNLITVD